MNTTKIRMQSPRFNFKPNIVSAQRKNIPVASPSTKPGERFGRRVAEVPVVMSNVISSHPFWSDSVTYKQSYASAMEPMDCDDWEENWVENGIYEENTAMADRNFRNPRKEPFIKQNVRNSSLSTLKQSFTNSSSAAEKPLRQCIISINDSNEFGFKLEPKKKHLSLHSETNFDISGQKMYPKWSFIQGPNVQVESKTSSLPRVFTVTVEKLLKWQKTLYGTQFIIELYGILEKTTSGKYSRSKVIVLKDEWMKESISCIFYEIDRVLPPIQKGHWNRCIILLRRNGDRQCISIRSATPNELKNLGKMVMCSSKEKALLLKTLQI